MSVNPQSSMRDSQKWDPDNYARTASFVPRLGAHLIQRLHPRRGELILDVGCGDGTLTADIAASGARVIGIDSSPEMVAAARTRGLDVRLMAAERLDLEERFDAAFSNAALHWVRDLDDAIRRIAEHLKAGGRFVGEFGGHGNVAAILTAILATLVFSFTHAMTAVSAVIFLATAKYNLATVCIVGRVEAGEYPLAIAYSLVLILLMATMLIVLQRLIGETRLGRRAGTLVVTGN